VGLALFAVAAAGVFALLSYFDAHDTSTTNAKGTQGPGRSDPASASARLRSGNIVLEYSAAADAKPLRAIALAEAGSAAPDAALIQAGQAVIVRRVATTTGVTARAYHRTLRAPSAKDPAVEDFVSTYLGQGAG
jgi:hypothetical protein